MGNRPYLVSAPVCSSLIGLVQLSRRYIYICKILAKERRELRKVLIGTACYSQGIVTAATITSALAWDSLHYIISGTHYIFLDLLPL